jgi:uncharacterized iron-regulated membrane protein
MLYQTARKIHRYMMFLVIFLTFVMWLTGQVMEEGWMIMTDFQARNLHRLSSKIFTPVLLIMIISGSILYFYPYLIKRKKTSQ